MTKILSKFGEQQLVMGNYACGFNQSETGKYFEWIIIIIIIIVWLGAVAGRNTVEIIEHKLQMNTLNFRKWERAKGQIKSTGTWKDLISKCKRSKKLNLE